MSMVTYNRKPIAELRERVSEAEALVQWERALLAQAEAEQDQADERARAAKVLAPFKAKPWLYAVPKPDTDPYTGLLRDIALWAKVAALGLCTGLLIGALGYASRGM